MTYTVFGSNKIISKLFKKYVILHQLPNLLFCMLNTKFGYDFE